MFGMASKDMDNYMPMPVELAHILLQELAAIRKEGREMTYLRPDSKSQVTIEYDDNDNPLRIHTIVLSTQHDEFIMPADDSRQAVKEAEKAIQEKIKDDVMHILIPRVISTLPDRIKPLFKPGFQLHVNPTGKFVTGGPNGDTGLTGRKIIVDTYGGKGLHGGGAFSGKDCSKVDRSGAYAARHIAKNLVAAGICDEVQVQIAYAIGIADPVGVYVNTNHTAHVRDNQGNIMHDGEISEKIKELFALRPHQIIKRFGLKNPIFLETTTYGHFGRDYFKREVEVFYENSETYRKTVDGQERIFKKVEFFPWEKLDYVDILRQEFNL
jgi:S-adenosylmethionine synthetase